MLACWRVGWGHRDSSTGAGSLVVELGSEVLVLVGPRDGVSPLVSRAGSWPSGVQGCVKWHVKRWLWVQELFRVGCPLIASAASLLVGCLDSGVPALNPTGCWIGPDL